MSDRPLSIHKQIQRIRTRIIVLGVGTVIGIALLLCFVPVDEKVEAHGRIRAERETYLYSPVDGILKEIMAFEGDSVEAGSPLAQLDAADKEGQLRETEARIEQAKAELDLRRKKFETVLKLPLPKEFWNVDEDLKIARKKKQQSETDLERASRLTGQGLMSQQDLEHTRLAVELSGAELAKEQEKLGAVQRGLERTILDEARAEIETAQATLSALAVERKTLLSEIERHTIRAPEAGVVTLVLKHMVGELAMKGTPLFHLSHGSPMRVDLFATEKQYYRIRPGQKVLMSTPAFDQLRYGYIEGVISRVAIEPEREETGDGRAYRIAVKITQTPQPLTLGATIDARIILRRTPLWRLLFPVEKPVLNRASLSGIKPLENN